MTGTEVLIAFAAVVVALLVVDLFVANRRSVGLVAAAVWSVVWIAAAVGFGLVVLPLYGGGEATQDYFAVFLVEKALSVDNVFLWLVVFTALEVPKSAQRRVLLYGVLGALVLRFGIINAGALIMERFTWILWIAGAFLVFTGYKMWAGRNDESDDDQDSALTGFVRRVLPTTDGFRDEKFVVREGGKLLATPLLLALVMVELADVVMALDALPATLAITTDVVVVMCGTGFALLGLRALFYLLAGVAARLRYLKVAVAVILVYIGASLIIENVIEAYEASTAMSLGVIGVVLALAVIASVRSPHIEAADEEAVAERIETIRALPWRDLEQLLSEHFRAEGYRALPTGSGTDRPVDMILKRDGERTVVQCKRWARSREVGESAVRDLHQVMVEESAEHAMLLTTGTPTSEARGLAREKSVTLMDGPTLESMLGKRVMASREEA